MPPSRSPRFDEFTRGQGASRAPEKRGRDEDVVVIRCTCCNHSIDLRTVHCNDCCDENSRRRGVTHRQGGSSRSSAKYDHYNRSAKDTYGEGSYDSEGRRSLSDNREASASAGSSGGGKRSQQPQPLSFVPEGRAPRLPSHDLPSHPTAERTLQRLVGSTATLNFAESEDLVDLSIEPTSRARN